MAVSKNNNPFSGLFQFYGNQVEKLQPVIKQGIDDVYTVYNKVWTEGMKLQSDTIKKWTGNESNSTYTDHAKEFGSKIIQVQKESTHAIADIGLKSLLSVIETFKKFTI